MLHMLLSMVLTLKQIDNNQWIITLECNIILFMLKNCYEQNNQLTFTKSENFVRNYMQVQCHL